MNEKLMSGINSLKQFITTKKSMCLKIVAVLIILIAIIVIALSFKGEKIGNTVGNSNNYGIAMQDGKWIYYMEFDDDEPVGICRVKNNGKKIEKVASGEFQGLNIIDNYIYCLEYEDSDYNLIKMKKNGKNKEILARDVDDETSVTVTDKWVYYSKNDNLYRVKTNGTERTKVSEREILYYQISDNWIYYIYETNSAEYIAKMKLNGEDSEKIAKVEDDEEFEALLVKGSKIYYVKSERNDDLDYEYYLYKMNKNGKKQEKVCKIDDNISNINMQEDYIYYTTTNNYEDYSIKCMKYNGTDKTTIKKDYMVSSINVVKNWVVYVTVNGDNESMMKMVSLDGEKEKEL